VSLEFSAERRKRNVREGSALPANREEFLQKRQLVNPLVDFPDSLSRNIQGIELRVVHRQLQEITEGQVEASQASGQQDQRRCWRRHHLGFLYRSSPMTLEQRTLVMGPLVQSERRMNLWELLLNSGPIL